jgi:hypothetical protein
MRKRAKVEKIPNNPLDRFSGKRARGRPPTIDPSWVRGSADRYRIWLERNWNEVRAPLLAAQTEQEVTNAFQSGESGREEFVPLVSVILGVLKDQKFPKRKKAQINFLADSIAGGEVVTPRRSRDICAEERKADAQRYMILRYEYWIECSCGYKGQSENHRCKRCGAVLHLPGVDSEFI